MPLLLVTPDVDTVADCHASPVRAAVRAINVPLGGLVLDFCGHCGAKHEEQLEVEGWELYRLATREEDT